VITISCSEFVQVSQATKELSSTYASEDRERRARIQQRVRRSAAVAAVGAGSLCSGRRRGGGALGDADRKRASEVQTCPPDNPHARSAKAIGLGAETGDQDLGPDARRRMLLRGLAKLP
jgi:hypothetical protein